MDLKSQAGLAGLLTGVAGSVQEIIEKQNQQKLANQRRTEVEQFQIGERENARAIRADQQSEEAQQEQERKSSGLKALQGYLAKPPKDQNEAQMNVASLKETNPELSPILEHSYKGLYPDTEPDYSVIPHKEIGKDGRLYEGKKYLDLNPASPTYQKYMKDKDNPDKEFISDLSPTTASSVKNKDYTKAGGSPPVNIPPNINSHLKSLETTVDKSRSAYEAIEGQAAPTVPGQGVDEDKRSAYNQLLNKAKVTHQTNLGTFSKQVDAVIGSGDYPSAKKTADSLKKLEGDKNAYWNGVIDAYMNKKSIDYTDFQLLKYKYHSLFGEAPIVSEPTGDDEEPQIQFKRK